MCGVRPHKKKKKKKTKENVICSPFPETCHAAKFCGAGERTYGGGGRKNNNLYNT